jgi:hypothetical protein
MSGVDGLAAPAAAMRSAEPVAGAGPAPAPGATAAPSTSDAADKRDVVAPDSRRHKERFLPVTRYALVDRLTRPASWPPGQAQQARRFFRYLDFWRKQQYARDIMELEQAYEPFSPDSDLLITRNFTDDERRQMQRRVVDGMAKVLERANYERIDPKEVEVILTRETHYGLDLHVDLSAFEEVLIYYRGASNRRHERRSMRRFWRKEEFDVPIFRRLFLLFKLKPLETRVREVMAEKRLTRTEAEKLVKKLRAMIPGDVREDCIYMKLFKNMPRSDIEMMFPNTQVRFRMLDKLKLGVTAGGGLGVGAFSSAGKLALLATNPIAAAGAVLGLGGIAFRQAMNFVNQRQRYMVVMAQNLYFHSMADNRGVMIKLADRAAEEDFKEEILLYSVLAKERAHRSDLSAIDGAIEQYVLSTFGQDVNFDLEDALSRLMADGIVTQASNGELTTLPPREAALHLDAMWDQLLDNLPDPTGVEGIEIDGDASPPPR